MAGDYSRAELAAIYELGRMYFEMGYFAPAERVFAGLAMLDDGVTPARLGLGVVKLERGLFEEAVGHFRASLENAAVQLEAKLGLCACFLAVGELARAKSILSEIAAEIDGRRGIDPEVQRLYEAFVIRCNEG